MATGTAHTAALRPFLLPVCFPRLGGCGPGPDVGVGWCPGPDVGVGWCPGSADPKEKHRRS